MSVRKNVIRETVRRETFTWGTVHRGIVRRENVFGELSDREKPIREMSVGAPP